MQSFGLLAARCLFALIVFQNGTAVIPGTFPPPETPRPSLTIDNPPVVVHGNRRLVVDVAKLRQEAAELSKLTESIPPDVDKAAKGELAQDLPARLKRIEKLAKQLRGQIAP